MIVPLLKNLLLEIKYLKAIFFAQLCHEALFLLFFQLEDLFLSQIFKSNF